MSKPENLYVAVKHQERMRIAVIFLRGRSFEWAVESQKLSIDCEAGYGCSFAEARVTETDKPAYPPKRLIFNQNNTVGRFLVRVYRDRVRLSQINEDFARQVEPAKPQGMA